MVKHSIECENFRKNHICFECPNCDNCIHDLAKLFTKVVLIGTPFENK